MKTHYADEISIINSPWDNPPEYSSSLYDLDGNGAQILTNYPESRQDALMLGIGHWEDCKPHGVFRDFHIRPNDHFIQPNRANRAEATWDGIRIHGSATLRNLVIDGVRGARVSPGQSKVGLTEAFGVLTQNRNPNGAQHGGSLIEDVRIIVRERNSYVTGVCAGTRLHEGQPIAETVLRRVDVCTPGGAHAGFTATRRARIEDCSATGVANAFWCDTDSLYGVTVDRMNADVYRAAVGLAVVPSLPGSQVKECLTIRDSHFIFTGQGPHYALEAFNPGGDNQIRGIRFLRCIFETPDNTPFLAISTDAALTGEISFDGCVFPSATRYNLPGISTANLSRIRVNGSQVNWQFPKYQLR